ncbi:hypothetical protein [Actinomadura rudentiformis]|uniref:Uncharacterized protein n=1 Tax=Actinomadura rudentiformis TaxID=359158 RepID=A0A6H9YL40_9ACTN|nr:hypothetical protein [Actinomadura rudentiformis]KAB2339996.1 hypothetical protein F8566_46470 [Actinomadura rudentiformis]
MLDPAAPAALKVRVVLRGDGAVIAQRVVTPKSATAVLAPVTGVRTLALEATAIAGRCGTAPVGYGIAYGAALK